MRWRILLLFLPCAVFTHRRGKARHGSFLRQTSDHSTFKAPLNCFAYLFSGVPNTSYISPSEIPELAALRAEWQTFREEALALYGVSRIQASDKYNDIGLNSFFCIGWKRSYLKWYDSPHPFAVALYPPTIGLLQRSPLRGICAGLVVIEASRTRKLSDWEYSAIGLAS
jgi:beta-hydroxylase